MRVLAITPVFPNAIEPLRSPSQRRQFAELSRRCDLTVLVPVPAFPFAGAIGRPERAARLAPLGGEDVVDGIRTVYTRTLDLPVGIPGWGLTMAAIHRHRALIEASDVVLGTWAYPHGAATVTLARRHGKPCVIKVHGPDLTMYTGRRWVKKAMAFTLPRADAIATVAKSTTPLLVEAGCAEERIHHLPNGIDTEMFRPRDKAEARRALGLPEGCPLLLYVGPLERRKGIEELLLALPKIVEKKRDLVLAIVGDGTLMPEALEAKARMGDSLMVTGPRAHEEIPQWMAACDVLIVPSWFDGTPSVVLEALACGRPVVASRIGDTPDFIEDGKNGLFCRAKDWRNLVYTTMSAFARKWDPAVLGPRSPITWRESASNLFQVLDQAARGAGPKLARAG
jgi:glycosyltransferase involved in cell wall biosynthesis